MKKLKSILDAMGSEPVDSNVNVEVEGRYRCSCMKCHNGEVIIVHPGSFGNEDVLIKAPFCWKCGTRLVYPSTFKVER